MKTLFQITALLLFSFAIISTSSAQKDVLQKDPSQAMDMTWDDAKESYHEIMAGTFHPAQEDDLQPLKDDYLVLALRAKKWSEMPIPKEIKTKELKKALKQLYLDSSGIGELVAKGAPDKDLKKAMFELHDVFHTIVGLCDH